MSVKQPKSNFSFLDGEIISYSVQIYSHRCDVIFIVILATASVIHFLSPHLTKKPEYGYMINFPGIHL